MVSAAAVSWRRASALQFIEQIRKKAFALEESPPVATDVAASAVAVLMTPTVSGERGLTEGSINWIESVDDSCVVAVAIVTELEPGTDNREMVKALLMVRVVMQLCEGETSAVRVIFSSAESDTDFHFNEKLRAVREAEWVTFETVVMEGVGGGVTVSDALNGELLEKLTVLEVVMLLLAESLVEDRDNDWENVIVVRFEGDNDTVLDCSLAEFDKVVLPNDGVISALWLSEWVKVVLNESDVDEDDETLRISERVSKLWVGDSDTDNVGERDEDELIWPLPLRDDDTVRVAVAVALYDIVKEGLHIPVSLQ